MKKSYVLALAALIGGPQVCCAAPALDAAQLGRMKGIVDVCSRVNAQQASRYFLQMKDLIGDASRETMTQVTRSDEYQAAYQSVTSELNGMGRAEMGRACADYLGSVD